jgi:hypothetical protein
MCSSWCKGLGRDVLWIQQPQRQLKQSQQLQLAHTSQQQTLAWVWPLQPALQHMWASSKVRLLRPLWATLQLLSIAVQETLLQQWVQLLHRGVVPQDSVSSNLRCCHPQISAGAHVSRSSSRLQQQDHQQQHKLHQQQRPRQHPMTLPVMAVSHWMPPLTAAELVQQQKPGKWPLVSMQ